MKTVIRSTRGVVVLALLALLSLSATRLHAQTTGGAILGNILDQSESAVPNVTITVTNQDTGTVRNSVSTGDGVYNVPSLLPGKYMVEAKAQGFNSIQVKDIVVTVGSSTRADLKLQVGGTTQTVTVTEAIPTVETTSSEVSQLMDENLIKNIPLNARDVQQLAVIQPGVQYLNTSGYGGRSLSVAGDRPINNRFLQEGMDMTTTYRVSPFSLASGIMLGAEAIKEFRVLTTNFTAEYGEMSGGTVNVLFKSGGNSLHGSAYEYYRNDAFDARNFFDQGPAPPFQRHQFGTSLSGPIRKDRTFFFVNFEGFRQNLGLTFLANVPDAASRLSAIPAIQQIFFSGANPLYPVCNGASLGGGLCQYFSNPVENTTENYGLVKIDHSFGAKNTLSSHYNIDKSNRFTPGPIGATGDDRVNNRHTFTIQDTHIFSPSFVNTARFGVNRTWYNDEKAILGDTSRVDPRLFPFQFLVPCATICTAASPNLPSGAETPVPVITVNGGLTQFGGSARAFNFAPRWIGYTAGLITDDVNYLHGKHAFQFGVQLKRWYDNIDQYRGNPIGAYTFANLAQFLAGGPAQTFSFDNQNAPGVSYGRNYRQSMYAVYGEDTFKLKPNLTLTFGLRWEYVPGVVEKHGRIANIYDPSPETAPKQPVLGTSFESTKTNFAPRLGFNYDPFKKGKTSVRGGFGMFFNEIEDSTYFTSGTAQYPFVVSLTLNNQMRLPYQQSIFDAALAGPQGNPTFASIERNPKTPTKYAYNLAIQQELPDHMTFMIAYVGAVQRHQGRSTQWQEYKPTAIEVPGQVPAIDGVPITYNGVPAPINPSCTQIDQLACLYWAGVGLSNANIIGNSGTLATNPSLPYANLCNATVHSNCFNNNNFGNSITGVTFDANSTYNSLQLALERRVSPGLLARFNYTWASCIEDSPDDLPGGESNGGGAAWTPARDHSANRHRCSFLGTNSANLTLNYDLPFGRFVSSGLAKGIIGGWQIGSLTSVSSGVPFDVRLGANVSRAAPSGNGNQHPDWAPGCNPQNAVDKGNPNHYIKSFCFQAPPAGYLGNMGPLILTAPTTWTTDVTLRKTIPLRESMNLQLTADMFNAFNRTNFASPASTTIFASNLTTPNTTAGQIINTIGTSRQFQIGARFQF